MAGKLSKDAAPTTGPGVDVVMKHLRGIKSAQQEAKEAAGGVGPLVKAAEEDGVHRKAALDAIKLSRQDATKISAYLKHFALYIGASYLNLTAQTDLFAAEKQTSTNIATPSDADGFEQRKHTARAQGHEAGLLGASMQSCTYKADSVENEKLIIEWKEGFKTGQNARSATGGDKKSDAPAPAADPGPAKAAAAPKNAAGKRTPKNALPPVAEDPRSKDEPKAPQFH